MAEKQYTWTDEDEVIDHTESVKKLWDSVMPTHPLIKSFETEGVKEIKHTARLGPYERLDHDLKYKVKAKIDSTPLKKLGWNGKDRITGEMVEKAYGKQYFIDLRERMRELCRFLGLRFSNFTFKGDIEFSTSVE